MASISESSNVCHAWLYASESFEEGEVVVVVEAEGVQCLRDC